MVYVITHDCGFKAELEFPCPQCGLPFCSEDHEQATRATIAGHLKNYKKITDVQTEVTTNKEYVDTQVKNKINEIVTWCNKHKKPHDANILPL